MKPIPKCFPLLLLLLTVVSQVSRSQTNNLYSYQELSHLFYQKQKDSLKKEWTCPVRYKEKATQKKYKEIWDERTDFFLNAITDDDYVYDKEISDYLGGIFNEIAKANKTYMPVQPMLFLDRSPSVNAYAIGNNVIAINLGLVVFARSREEIALTVAHEMSHNILEHAETSMRKRAEWLTSDEYKQSMEDVLDSRYQRLTRLKKIFENYSFDRSRHQRYRESDADSLAIILLKNAHMGFDPAFFLRLDSADMVYRQPLKQPVKNYFSPYNITIDEAWLKKRSKGLSTRSYNFQEAVALQDSMKTHPDCIERYNNTKAAGTVDQKMTPVPARIKEKAGKMMIWNMYCNMNLAPCLYRVLMEKDNGNTDPWYDFMLHNIMLELFHADRELHRFSAIGVTQKEYISKDYYELQTMLEQIPREELEKCCQQLQKAAFWANMPKPEQGMKNLLNVLTTGTDNTDEAGVKAAKEFVSSNDTSLYCEFANDIKKK
ncbi:M48 family metalloprotease [Chitinophaga filiformis]|uniref:Peptidase family M48 n=1 Tax=Chitinophaga filiformis TaxID=104663 RepID=A0A1G7P6G6_CHIFI|nr:M48 family metalloprotease [Chitinophaga filiformis]SDF81926.1 Peptidase family M48 [Chitinophaga filiformis]